MSLKNDMLELIESLPAWMILFQHKLQDAIKKGQGNLGTAESYELLEEFAKWEIFLCRNAGSPQELNTEVVYTLFKLKSYLYPSLL